MNRPAFENHGSASTEPPKAVKRALLSVSDKTGVLEFATALAQQGVELLSTGGTAQLLADAGIPVVEVSEHTGFPEMMGGRVKTLHPVIHGGILGRRGTDDVIMSEHAIAPIDLVVVNLYPFASAVARPDCTLEDAIENIDIGGPAMLRSAAKNYISVAVVSDPADYAGVMTELTGSGGLTDSHRFNLALKAFSHTAAYDAMISHYLGSAGELDGSNCAQAESAVDQSSLSESSLPATLNLQFRKLQDMRYGENPHQIASFYRHADATEADIAGAVSIQGKPLSYNNIADADAALECVRQFDTPACVIVKHANPCGVALAPDLLVAYEKAYQCDPTSAFGGILAFNRPITGACVAQILETQFVEVLLAPSFDDTAREALKKKPAVRALQFSADSDSTKAGVRQEELDATVNRGLKYQTVSGGLLVQSVDNLLISADGLKVVTEKSPSDTEIEDLLFAWKVAKFVKSNAIVYARNQQTIGIGAGQMSRVYSARIAAIKARDESLQVAGSVMSSDAFFPFRDGIDSAAQAGIVAVIQPGGSNNDQQVIDAANEHGMAMVFTGMRHFRH